MKDYSCYLFDADGTLIDTTELICRCFENTARQTGHEYAGDSLTMQYIGLPLRKQMEVYYGKIDDSTYTKYQSIHMNYQLEVYKKYLKPFPGVADVLDRLKKKGCKLAVVTSRMRSTLDLYLSETNIMSYFDVIISPESTKAHKPDPEPALLAMKELGAAAASDVLFIGDATYDIECGASAGTDTAFVKWSINSVLSLRVAPTWILNKMNDLVV